MELLLAALGVAVAVWMILASSKRARRPTGRTAVTPADSEGKDHRDDGGGSDDAQGGERGG